ncbi:MAG: outer membrane beta-barrel protein [Candidatus Aminicenantes bacterium]|nr:outer membrane beta-barrel protein [Candidatus Aminicenantes bacterium]
MRARRAAAAAAIAAALATAPAGADLSAFAGTVEFDGDVNLESAPGFGLRWGRSGATFGGETSLMISRPTRNILGVEKTTTTAIFYEGRFLVNFPTGNLKPFAGVGLGAVTLTATDPPGNIEDADLLQTLDAISELQTSTSLSYGGGIRYRVQERLDIRFDLRQYLVFSVRGAVFAEASRQVEEVMGADLGTEDYTVQYNEISAGIVVNF